IDPALLQQTLQQGGLLSHSLGGDGGLISHSGAHLMTSGADPGVPGNVVLHPLTSLTLQPATVTPTQDLSHVISSSGLMSGVGGGGEITLTINNSTLSQALAQAQAQAVCAGAGPANTQEITLTISGQDLLPQHGAPGGQELSGGIRLSAELGHFQPGARALLRNTHPRPEPPRQFLLPPHARRRIHLFHERLLRKLP
ncbi:hypothetical protein CRUP_011563, partial [Coryphaenoides rupestris]